MFQNIEIYVTFDSTELKNLVEQYFIAIMNTSNNSVDLLQKLRT